MMISSLNVIMQYVFVWNRESFTLHRLSRTCEVNTSEMTPVLSTAGLMDKMSYKKVSCHSQLSDICKKRPVTFKTSLPWQSGWSLGGVCYIFHSLSLQIAGSLHSPWNSATPLWAYWRFLRKQAGMCLQMAALWVLHTNPNPICEFSCRVKLWFKPATFVVHAST